MSHYRLSHLDLSTRFHIAVQMLDPSRPWGLVTDLAKEYGVSRKFLYQQRDKAGSVLLTTLAAKAPGRKPASAMLAVDRDHLRRSIVTLATAMPGSIRNIQTCLELVLESHRSIGFISQTLQQAGEAASQQNQQLSLPHPILGYPGGSR